MKLTAKLALSQIIINQKRTVWTLIGIMLSVSMLTAICGFIASGDTMMTELLGDDYYRDNPQFIGTIIGIGAVLGSIIAAVSVVVVSNAFRVSAGERAVQFGMLKSVGATKRQIAETVIYEGLWLSLIGIPLGIILGMAVHFIGIEVANYYLISINKLNNSNIVQLDLQFVFRWWAVAASAAASFFTVLLSAWLPAQKASKTTAIDAIRGTDEIKVKAKRVRSNWIIEKIFGFEGMLASKSLRRSRRNFRATVVSLIVSVVLVIIANGFGSYGFSVTNSFYPDSNVNAVADYASTVSYTYGEDGTAIDRKVYPLEYELAEQIIAKLREYPNTTVFGVGGDHYVTYESILPQEMLSPKMREYLGVEQDEYFLPVTLITVDRENYMRLCEAAKAEYGSNILINRIRVNIDGVKSEFEPFIFKNQTLLLDGITELTELPLHGSLLPLHGSLAIKDVPSELMEFTTLNGISVIIPECDAVSYEFMANTEDDDGFVAYAGGIFDDMVPQSELYITMVVSLNSIYQAMNDMRNLVLTFIYGFVGMLILVGLTNVISTISTNIRSRSREFAVLRSVGMTDAGLHKMLNLESILSSARALLFGIPIGCILSYMMYRATVQTADFPYEFPWVAVFQCIIGVFAVTWVTMRYSASRLRRGNIIETIRSKN